MMRLLVSYILLSVVFSCLCFADAAAQNEGQFTWLKPLKNASEVQQLENAQEQNGAGVTPAMPDSRVDEHDATEAVEALRFFTMRGVFNQPLSEALMEQPVTTSEWLGLLYEAIDEKPWFLNDAAYYPDVPVSSWAFPAFEQFRLKNWFPRAGFNEEGYAFPDRAIDRLEALTILGRTLEAQPYNWGSAQQLLDEYAIDVTAIPSLQTQESLARVIAAGFWPLLGASTESASIVAPVPTPQAAVDLTSPMSRSEALNLAYHRYAVTEQREAVLTDEDKRIPEGLSISVSPTAVVFWERLDVGMPLYFTLNSTITGPELPSSVPMGSRVFGRVISLTAPTDQSKSPIAKVVLEQVVLFGGQRLTMNANVVFVFPQEEPRWFLPGSRFETITKKVERLSLPTPPSP